MSRVDTDKIEVEGRKVIYCSLYSRLPHDVTIQYGADIITVPPRGNALNLNKSKLGAVPKGVSLVVNN